MQVVEVALGTTMLVIGLAVTGYALWVLFSEDAVGYSNFEDQILKDPFLKCEGQGLKILLVLALFLLLISCIGVAFAMFGN